MMPRTTTITAEVEAELKDRVEAILKKMGLTVSEAISLFFRQVEQQNELPFETLVPNRTTRRVLSDSKKGKNLVRYNSAEEFFSDVAN